MAGSMTGGVIKGNTSQLPGPGAAPIDVGLTGEGCGNGYDGPATRAMDSMPPGGEGSSGSPSSSSPSK